MKKLLLSFLTVALFSVCVSAQQREFGKHAGKKHHHGMDLQKLNLSDKQKTDIKNINADFREQMTALQKEDNLTVKDWKGRKQTLRKEYKAKLQSVLTAEQKEQLAKAKEERKAKQKQMAEERMGMIKQKLALTDDQSAKMKELHTGLRDQIRSIRENQSLAKEDKKAQIKELIKENHEKVKSILTEEQLQKLKDLRQEGRGKRHMTS